MVVLNIKKRFKGKKKIVSVFFFFDESEKKMFYIIIREDKGFKGFKCGRKDFRNWNKAQGNVNEGK